MRIAQATARSVTRLGADDQRVPSVTLRREARSSPALYPPPRRSPMHPGVRTTSRPCFPTEKVAGETYRHGDRIRAYIVGVERTERGPLHHAHAPTPTRWDFQRECVLEIQQPVKIKAIAREAGHRTKIAVAPSHARRQRQGRVSSMGARVRSAGWPNWA